MKEWMKVLLVAVPLMGLAACGTTGEKNEGGDIGAPGGEAGAETSGAGAGGSQVTPLVAEGGNLATGEPTTDPSSPLSKRVIYFDYDSNTVKDEFRPVVEAHARYLVEHPTVKATLEGHADERGTREYNIALGERRAIAVRQMMSLTGVPSDQIATVSYGEERPVALGHDDDSWGQNRRVEIMYIGR